MISHPPLPRSASAAAGRGAPGLRLGPAAGRAGPPVFRGGQKLGCPPRGGARPGGGAGGAEPPPARALRPHRHLPAAGAGVLRSRPPARLPAAGPGLLKGRRGPGPAPARPRGPTAGGWRRAAGGGRAGPGARGPSGGREGGRGGAGAHGEPAPAVAGLSVRGRPRPPAPGGCGSCGRAQAKTWALGGRLRRSGRAELACAGVKLAANGVSPEERRRAVETVAVTAFPAPTYERSDLQSLVCATNTTQ